MSKRFNTKQELLVAINAHIAKHKDELNQTEIARQVSAKYNKSFTPQRLSNILHGSKPIPDYLLDALGVKHVEYWEV